jgi:hypothetical protein
MSFLYGTVECCPAILIKNIERRREEERGREREERGGERRGEEGREMREEGKERRRREVIKNKRKGEQSRVEQSTVE